MENKNLKKLNTKIYYMKEYLYRLMDYYDLTNIKVVNCSKELDKLIVEYEYQHNEKNIYYL
ncbi:aspartyl-phosphate phosphatase Spo0E family protein [Clostridium niameyense]|uniref:Aspartyl-phosphate phosphatase Spo0E family protein n=1 Tax=Clostridium niameyense TaxID=1622073 RepID=A0A6M0R6V7_9CLOT|nr:aspartyl-phosphate phosphatase Spo0E family protein [Clostridium niameyense]NEZ45935.1 aspartyl-phosphate phosphatase Spo0E family protein [Clostridium niameyense]